MYYRFAKAFHFLSIILFLIVLLYSYSSLSDLVAYEINDAGYPTKQLAKSTFFYLSIILFTLINVVLVTPAKLVENQSVNSLKRLFPVGDQSRDLILAWLYSFAGIVNFSLLILVNFVRHINTIDELDSGVFNIFFYLIPVFFVVWILALFWILQKKLRAIQSRTQNLEH